MEQQKVKTKLTKIVLQVFAFYGSDVDLLDLPLPRQPHHTWALKHEESPKNNEFLFSFEEIMTLFNYTSTFKRQSHYPIETQDLPNIEWLQGEYYF